MLCKLNKDMKGKKQLSILKKCKSTNAILELYSVSISVVFNCQSNTIDSTINFHIDVNYYPKLISIHGD